MIRTLTGGDLAARRDEIVAALDGGNASALERDGQIIAVLIAPPLRRDDGVYLDDLIARVGNLRMPGDGFADDVEAGIRFFAESLRDPWDS
jgi:hypothetical protein